MSVGALTREIFGANVPELSEEEQLFRVKDKTTIHADASTVLSHMFFLFLRTIYYYVNYYQQELYKQFKDRCVPAFIAGTHSRHPMIDEQYPLLDSEQYAVAAPKRLQILNSCFGILTHPYVPKREAAHNLRCVLARPLRGWGCRRNISILMTVGVAQRT